LPVNNPRFYRWYALLILTFVYVSNIADRYVISTLIEPIKTDLKLNDTAIGFLTGTALAIFYTGMGIPLGLMADRVNRRNLVAFATVLWSAMTAACGAANTFLQLLLARIGVGVGEAGGTPASQSMISDFFPFNQRALATSIYALGAAAGSMIGSIVGGAISDVFGWRSAFVALAIPGAVLALLVRLTLTEPARGAFDTSRKAINSPSLKETLQFIRVQPSLLHVLAGSTVAVFWGWGLLWWTPAFLARSYGMSTSGAGGLIGMISGIGGTAGIILGAVLTQKLALKDPRWQPWIAAAATVLGTFASMGAYSCRSLSITTRMLWLFVPVAYLNIAPSFALTQSLVPPRMRGLACAVMLFGANVANLAIAPQLIGIASDVLRIHYGAGRESLRYALMGTALSGFWAAYHFWAAGRYMRDGLRRAGTT
jgi:predicted MFS family arabinose efflux permease